MRTDAEDLDDAISGVFDLPRASFGEPTSSSEKAQRRFRSQLRRVLGELPAGLTVGEMLELLDS